MRSSGSVWKAMVLAGCVIASLASAKEPERIDERDALRSRMDAARGRQWVLGRDEVRVYDAEKKTLIKRIRLPNWTVARFICRPDIAIDQAGAAVVSSNVDARVWRIEAGSFRVTEYEIRLNGRERWDIGFGALAFAADGRLFAVTTLSGTVWSVDVAGRSARLLDSGSAYLNRCELSPRTVNELERRRKP